MSDIAEWIFIDYPWLQVLSVAVGCLFFWLARRLSLSCIIVFPAAILYADIQISQFPDNGDAIPFLPFMAAVAFLPFAAAVAGHIVRACTCANGGWADFCCRLPGLGGILATLNCLAMSLAIGSVYGVFQTPHLGKAVAVVIWVLFFALSLPLVMPFLSAHSLFVVSDWHPATERLSLALAFLLIGTNSFLWGYIIAEVRSWNKASPEETLRRFGLCPICGYDLRASDERCPECGTPIPDEIRPRIREGYVPGLYQEESPPPQPPEPPPSPPWPSSHWPP
jgi:hypothetical protein